MPGRELTLAPVCPLHRRGMELHPSELPTFEMSPEFKGGKRIKRQIWKCPVKDCRCVQNGPVQLKHAQREPKMEGNSFHRS